MTDTKPDLKPNERKVLDSLLTLGEATAAKVGENAGLAYSSTTPKLRKLEDLGLAERFHNDANQTLWRATNTQAAAGTDDTADKTGQAASPAADKPVHPGNSDTTEADDAVANDSTAPEAGEAAPHTPAAPAAAVTADPPAETEEAQPEEAAPEDAAPQDAAPEEAAPEEAAPEEAEPQDAGPEKAEPEEAEPEEPRGDAPDSTTSAMAEPAPTGDDAAAGEDAAAPADPPAPKAKRKRPAGALEASVLAILQADPTGQYKINDLRKLVDKADENTGYPAASAGAIANALDKLTGKGHVVAIPAKHATFQAAPTAS
jgi:hypothetical protein